MYNNLLMPPQEWNSGYRVMLLLVMSYYLLMLVSWSNRLEHEGCEHQDHPDTLPSSLSILVSWFEVFNAL